MGLKESSVVPALVRAMFALYFAIMPPLAAAEEPRSAFAPSGVKPPVVTIERIRQILSRCRDLLFKEAVPLTTFTAEEYERRVREESAVDRDRTASAEIFLRKIGLLAPDADKAKGPGSGKAISVSGFYDTATRQISLAADLSPEVRPAVLAHELTHALQDQHFDLDDFDARIRRGAPNDDAVLAGLALIEGEASSLMLNYELWEKDVEFTALPNPVAQNQMLGALLDKMYPQTRRLPDATRSLFLFPYVYGWNFLREVRLLKPWSFVNTLYADPPQSTEQIMHPEKYLTDRDPPTDVELADLAALKTLGWARRYANTLGEYRISLLLARHVDAATASLASEGWDGDRAALYEDAQGGRHLFFLSTWDTRRDAEEFFHGYGRVVPLLHTGAQLIAGAEGHVLRWTAPPDTICLEIRGNDVLLTDSSLTREQLEPLRRIMWATAARARPAVAAAPAIPAPVAARTYFDKALLIKKRFEYRGGDPELAGAEILMREAVRLDPSCSECLTELADLVIRTSGYSRKGIEEAQILVNKAALLGPETAEVYRLQAFSNNLLGRQKQAAEFIGKALALHPDNPRYYKIQGEIYRAQGKVDLAVGAWRQGLSCPGDPHVLAALHSNLGGYEKEPGQRLKLCEKALDLEPSPTNQLDFARALLANKRYDDAVYASSKVLKEHISSHAYLVRGIAERALGDLEAAERDFRLAAESGGIFDVARLFVREGDLKRAAELEAWFQGEREVSGQYYLNLGSIYDQNQKPEEAIERYQHALEKDPALGEASLMLAIAYAKKSLPDKAAEYFARAAAVKDPSPRICYESAKFFLTSGKSQEAYDLLKKATTLDENNSTYWYTLGTACEDYLQLHAEAVSAFIRVIELVPDFANTYYVIGKAYANLEDYEKSALHWRTYLKLSPDGTFSAAIRQRIDSPPWKRPAPQP